MEPTRQLTYSFPLLMLCYFVPPALIFTGWVNYEYRYHIMVPVILISIIYAFWKGFRKNTLGMRWDNFRKAASWQLVISLSMTLSVLLLLGTGYVRDLEPPQNPWFYVMYLFISGPVQETVYRAIPFAALDRYTMPDWSRISLVTLNFAWLHVIYFDWIVFGAALIMGFVWTLIYHYHRNLWAVSIAHALTGFSAIWFGLI